MNPFVYRDDRLHAEDVSCELIAREFDTPCYVYSRAAIEARYQAFEAAFAGRAHLICYAVKANSNLAILNLLARMGAGFDIVSIGELERVLRAGGDPGKVVFSGVGKRAEELRTALGMGIRCFNVESESELARLNEIAGQAGLLAPVSLRVNPDVDARTHPYIATGLSENKFGIDIETAESLYRRSENFPHIEFTGIDCHIGSQLTDLSPLVDALDRVLGLAERLSSAGVRIRHLDLGGGLGVRYRDEQPPAPADWAEALFAKLAGRDYEILLEPGRAIVAEAGMLLTRVEHLKRSPTHQFAIVDAAMNDLMRPSLYQAWHDIIPVRRSSQTSESIYDVVGPVCETGDYLGKGRSLALDEGDLLAVMGAGAYGASMSSNYNSRPRAAEVMVEGAKIHCIRKRETVADLLRGEQTLP